MERICRGFDVLRLEDGTDAALYYYLETYEQETQGKYGIYLEKEVNEQLVEWECTGGFIDDLADAEYIISLLLHNRITPCVLREVIYDYLCAIISG
ncbi:MAG: hypothetical protein II073_09400 [Lachnospiraceae bacterium]|nr:hypothetical protein [Lachnospiraceae bacterium]